MLSAELPLHVAFLMGNFLHHQNVKCKLAGVDILIQSDLVLDQLISKRSGVAAGISLTAMLKKIPSLKVISRPHYLSDTFLL